MRRKQLAGSFLFCLRRKSSSTTGEVNKKGKVMAACSGLVAVALEITKDCRIASRYNTMTP
jgi:hypothetical protein